MNEFGIEKLMINSVIFLATIYNFLGLGYDLNFPLCNKK